MPMARASKMIWISTQEFIYRFLSRSRISTQEFIYRFLSLVLFFGMLHCKLAIVPLYKAIVRAHLEYCIQARRPYPRKDIGMLEKIQRRASTEVIPGLRDISCEERLKECGLTTLETRRLIKNKSIFKILNGHENIELQWQKH